LTIVLRVEKPIYWFLAISSVGIAGLSTFGHSVKSPLMRLVLVFSLLPLKINKIKEREREITRLAGSPLA
jgi:hypothetical protein